MKPEPTAPMCGRFRMIRAKPRPSRTRRAADLPHPFSEARFLLQNTRFRASATSQKRILRETSLKNCKLKILAHPAHLSSPQLTSAHLSSPQCISAHLSASQLTSAHLSSSQLISAHFSASQLISAHLSASQLISAHLSSSQLISAHLSSSQRISAHLGSLSSSQLTLSWEKNQKNNLRNQKKESCGEGKIKQK